MLNKWQKLRFFYSFISILHNSVCLCNVNVNIYVESNLLATVILIKFYFVVSLLLFVSIKTTFEVSKEILNLPSFIVQFQLTLVYHCLIISELCKDISHDQQTVGRTADNAIFSTFRFSFVGWFLVLGFVCGILFEENQVLMQFLSNPSWIWFITVLP